jgi:hypothetical protein
MKAMSSSGFSPAQAYVVKNWQQASKIEEAMKSVRLLYAEIGERVVVAVQDSHPELDWPENSLKRSSTLGIGKKKWARGDSHAYIGVEYIGLDELTADSPEDEPFIGIWTGEQRQPLTDVNGIKRIQAAAEELLTKDELDSWEWSKASDYDDESNDLYQCQFTYYLPEKRTELLDMILKDEGKPFVECLAKHFESYARFFPVLDEVFAKTSAKPRKK